MEEAKLQVQANVAGVDPKEAGKISLRGDTEAPTNDAGRLEALQQIAARGKP